MPRMRQRAKVCTHCMLSVDVTADVDTKEIRSVRMPPTCPHQNQCWTELTHDIFDHEFEVGTRKLG